MYGIILVMKKMFKIYTTEDKKEEKFLRESSIDVSLELLKSKEFQNFLDNFIYTAKTITTQEGFIAAGLAAVQVGKHYNVLCILREKEREFEIMINPKMEILSTVIISEREGCLSVPKIERKIPRFKKVKVRYLDRDGNTKKGVFSDFEAIEVQHEYDHTKGILFIDRV